MQSYKSIYFLILIILFTGGAKPQSNDKPRLVVGIVVDQMRFEYLYRFNDCYREDGFKRLMKDGTNFTFAHFNYTPTSTGPGHATIYTGTTPFYHGIIGNNFYDRSQEKSVYCVGDENYQSIGSDDDAGQKSPKRLFATTITDQLKIASKGKSKVIAVSLKDRGAVLPGGHNPDGAYWYNDKTGNFITSSYYTNSLPSWVIEFNNKKLPDVYLSAGWRLSLEKEKYEINSPDESKYEKDRFKEGKTSFPHNFDNLSDKEKYGEFENTPFANQIVAEFAKAVLYNENLGRGNETDFLAISFSATDHMGHEYGTLSYELQDTYIKLDEQLSDIFHALDDQVGKGNYILFLTADHAAIPTPGYLKDNKMPAGELNHKKTFELIKRFAKETYGDEKIIVEFSNKQIFLDWKLLRKKKLDRHKVQQETADFLRENIPAITSIYTRDFLETQISHRDQKNPLVNGFNPVLSGDVVFEIRPGYLVNLLEKGTTHGSSYNYDSHVPLLFYGWNIPAQTVNTPVYVIDIAPTIADLLKITEPSAAIGIPLIR